MLEVLAGRSGSDKTKELYRQIKTCLDRGEDHLFLLVPEQYTLEAEKELMEVLELQGFFQVEVLGFSRFIDGLVNRALEREKTVVTATGKRMILKHILRDKEEELQAFGNLVRKPGFAAEVENVLQGFKENMVEPEDLRRFARQSPKQGPLERKVLDMASVYEAYEAFLDRGYTDNEHVIADATGQIALSSDIPKSKIWIHGFHTFTKQLIHLIQALADHALHVCVTLDLNVEEDSPDSEIFAINRKTLHAFQELWAEGISLKTFPEGEQPETEIHHLSREFFSYPYKKWQGAPSTLQVLESQNVYREMEHAAREMVTLVRQEGWTYRDMAVVVNDLETYGFPVQRTLEEFGIPYFIDEKRSMGDKPLGLFVRSSLQALVHNYRYEDVFSMVKTGFSLLEEEEGEALENYCLQFGIRGSQWKGNFYKTKDPMVLSLDALNELRSKLVEPLETFREKIKHHPTFAAMAKALYEYLEDNRCLEKTRLLAVRLQEEGHGEQASENNQVFNRVVELLDELVEVFGDEKTTLREFADLFIEGITASELGVLPGSEDVVLVGDVKRTRQGNLKGLFLLGVNEGILPGEGEVLGIFTNLESRKLEEARLPLFQDREYLTVQEQYLFQQLLSKEPERIYFSCAQSDFEGGALRPSPYLKRILELFPDLVIQRDHQEADYWITNARGTLRPMIAGFRKAIDLGHLEQTEPWQEAFSWYESQEDWQETMDYVADALVFTNHLEPLTPKQVRELYGTTIRNSVTSLETYGQCPFRYYVRYGLRPGERPVYEVSIPDMGELLHDSLQQYTRWMEEKNIPWNQVEEEERIAVCSAIVEEKIQNYKDGVFASKGRYRYLGYYLNRLMLRAVNVLTYHMGKGAFRLEKAEASFGENREFPPVRFEYEDISMVLEGRIDRVDVYRKDQEVYVKIIDYKSGEKVLDLKDVYYGLTLQLLVYLQVCLQSMPGSKPAGAFYFKLDDPLIEGFSYEKDLMEQKIRNSLRLSGVLVRELDVAYALDKDLEENPGDSDVMTWGLKKDGDFKQSGKGLLEEAVFHKVLEHTMNTARKMGEEIVSGNMKVAPVKNKGKSPCRYCKYGTICQFDEGFEGNPYRVRRGLKEQEVVEILMGGTDNE